MYTQCPQCQTIFEIDEDALQVSFGIVHCGHCGQRFDALRTLSETLPVGPGPALVERDLEERIPTLTATVPLARMATGTRYAEGTGEPATPAHPSGPHAPLPLENVEGGVPAGADRPSSSDNADWFADLETELAPSLLTDAVRAATYELRGPNAWQVSDLPSRTHFPGADIAITFEDSWTSDSGSATPPDWRGPPNPGPIDPADDSALRAAEPIAPDGSGSPATTQAEIPFEEIGPADLEGFAPPPIDAAAVARPAQSDGARAPLDDGTPDDGPTTLAIADANPIESPEPGAAAVVSDPATVSPPVYVRPRRRRGTGTGIAWALGCLVLALALAAQLAWIQRVGLVRDPATHAWAMRVCAVIDCRLPPIRDLAKLELLSRDVRPDPHTADALMITATVRNDAAFRQPWPVVVVELTNLDNNPVAMRRFQPAEYMPDPARRAAGIAPGATSAIAFEVVDPGKRAVAFQFGFE